MSEIQGGRWDRVLRHLFPVKAQAVAPAVANEIMPTMELQRFDPDLYHLRGERLLMGGAIIGPVAAQYSQVNLRNDSADKLVIVEHITCTSASGSDQFRVAVGNNAVGTAQSVYGRDMRDGLVITAGSVAGVVRSSTEVAAITGNGLLFGVWATLDLVQCSVPFVLAPTHALFVAMITSNRGLLASFAWRERPFEPGEVL